MNNSPLKNWAAIALAAMIVVGCGQKGPLTLPTPQFPAPDAKPPAKNP